MRARFYADGGSRRIILPHYTPSVVVGDEVTRL
jgi:hypothetical protein